MRKHDSNVGVRRCGLTVLTAVLLLHVTGCSVQKTTTITPVVESTETQTAADETTPAEKEETMSDKLQTATFGAGCYWCTEAVFQRLEGVENVASGFMGGEVVNPTYEAVCRGITGHAEVIQFTYDPKKVSFETLLEVFWKTHDPTTLNKQGYDEGTQYRSAVFWHTPEQRDLAEKYKAKLDEAGIFNNPIVTEITEASIFYKAKGDHQNYYNANPNQRYCAAVINPKIDKLKAVFADKLKTE